MSKIKVFFWAIIPSPHMVALASSLKSLGFEVSYCYFKSITSDRISQGWQPLDYTKSISKKIESLCQIEEIVRKNYNSIHICQGIRSNGDVSKVQKLLRKYNINYWAILETVSNAGIKGFIRRFTYYIYLKRYKNNIKYILAIGYTMKNWIVDRGFDPRNIFDFAYFLDIKLLNENRKDNSIPVFIYVGQLIPRKNVGMLLECFRSFEKFEYKLIIIGHGKLESKLKHYCNTFLSNRVDFKGSVNMSDVPNYIYNADCLILPSVHDGWGAVVSEALILGTKVIVSDSCGSAGVAMDILNEGVFKTHSIDDLKISISNIFNSHNQLSSRKKIQDRATCLNSDSGAMYLANIIRFFLSGEMIARPDVPWKKIIN